MIKKFLYIFTKTQRRQTIWSLVIIALATLAITVPFADQAFTVDGPEVINFSQRQIEQPFAQDLPDHFNNRGIFYDSYIDTHPKFLSLYLSLFIRIVGEPSEVPIHLSLMIFPFIGAVSMFFLGRRFRVSGLAASLLFLVSPMLMVSTHTAMVDVPGVALSIAAIAAFIFAVDKKSNWLLGLSTLLMVLACQTFFQGLLALPVALAYLVINRRFQIRNFIPIISTALFFGAYLAAVLAVYDQLPRFSYRPRLSTVRQAASPAQLRGNLTVLGGTLLFPFVAIFGFIARWTSVWIFIATSIITWSWSLVKFALGEYSLSEAALLSVMLSTGVTIMYLMLERFAAGIFKRRSMGSRAAKDAVFLTVWFFIILGYTTLLLPYPTPRYLLPLVPATILVLLIVWRKYFKRSWVRFSLAGGAIALTLAFSTLLSLMNYHIAHDRKLAAEWAVENYGDGAWYNGTFGFGYYMNRFGFRLTPSIENELFRQTTRPYPLEEPQPGDYVIYSLAGGAWVPYPSVMQRLRNEDVVLYYNNQIFATPCAGEDICWWYSLFLPFKIDTVGELSDVVMVWRIDDTPYPLSEGQKELYREVGITWIEELEER